MLGLSEGPLFEDTEEGPALPKNLPPVDEDAYLFGDYTVCPFTTDKPGAMRAVCLAEARNVMVVRR